MQFSSAGTSGVRNKLSRPGSRGGADHSKPNTTQKSISVFFKTRSDIRSTLTDKDSSRDCIESSVISKQRSNQCTDERNRYMQPRCSPGKHCSAIGTGKPHITGDISMQQPFKLANGATGCKEAFCARSEQLPLRRSPRKLASTKENRLTKVRQRAAEQQVSQLPQKRPPTDDQLLPTERKRPTLEPVDRMHEAAAPACPKTSLDSETELPETSIDECIAEKAKQTQQVMLQQSEAYEVSSCHYDVNYVNDAGTSRARFVDSTVLKGAPNYEASPEQKVSPVVPVETPAPVANSLSTDSAHTPQKVTDACGNPLLDEKDDFDHWSPLKLSQEWPPLPGWRQFERYTVVGVDFKSECAGSLLRLQSTDGLRERCITLRGGWRHTRVEPGDTVHVLGTGPNDVIDNMAGQLVVHPDRLISGTAVVAATFCRRKAVLSELTRGGQPSNKHMLLGSVVHALFQAVVRDKLCSREELKISALELLRDIDIVHQAYGGDISMAELEADVLEFIDPTLAWIQQYTQWGSGVKAPFMNATCQPSDRWHGQITALRDIEENIWSPRLGVKGKIDLTVAVRDGSVLPLELKTGRASFSAEHQGQVSLYAMMAMERQPTASPTGLLVYLRTGATRQISCRSHQQRDLLQLRNELTDYLARAPNEAALEEPLAMPEVLSSERSCRQCPLLVPCAALQRRSGGQHVVADAVTHLNAAHLDYFVHWSSLVRLEAAAGSTRSSMNRLWTEDVAARCRHGVCIPYCRLIATESAGAGGWLHKLESSTTHTSNLAAGELVIVSTDDELALAMGPLQRLQGGEAHVLLQRQLNPNRASRFHLDKYEFGGDNSSATYIGSLAQLLENSERALRLRKRIIDYEPASFLPGLGRAVVVQSRAILRPLNKLQQRAMLRALMARDYLLIHGLPGTGKTSTVVALVRMLVACGLSVLLASYTHSAVDTILLRLSRTFTQFVRLGRPERVHQQLQPFCAERLTAELSTPSELESFYDSRPVVATTCLGINHAVCHRRHFDVCIIDEASQTLQPAALGPLLLADRFILVGDPLQLPPIIQSAAARRAGMQQCLFSRLANDDNTVRLTVQYRMNRTLMQVANAVAYDGTLSCGSDAVAEATLPPALQGENYPSWLTAALDSRLERALVLLDTDTASEKHISKATNVSGRCEPSNALEAGIVVQLVEALMHRHVSGDQVGVIAPYRGQVRLLRSLLPDEVEVSTVDQYQGRDKSTIIYSCTRSTSRRSNSVGNDEPMDILSDQRRLTVAITRAKHKLVIVGSRRTLLTFPPFNRLLTQLQSEDIVALPPDCIIPVGSKVPALVSMTGTGTATLIPDIGFDIQAKAVE